MIPSDLRQRFETIQATKNLKNYMKTSLHSKPEHAFTIRLSKSTRIYASCASMLLITDVAVQGLIKKRNDESVS